MRVDDALLDKIADEFIAVKEILTHQHSAVITFEQFLEMRLKKMGHHGWNDRQKAKEKLKRGNYDV